MNHSKKKIFDKITRLYLGPFILLTLAIIYALVVEQVFGGKIEKFVEKLQPPPTWTNPKVNPPNNKGQQEAPPSFQTKPKSKPEAQRKRRVEGKPQEKSPKKEQLLDEQGPNFRFSPGKQAEEVQDFRESVISNQLRDIRTKGVNDSEFLKFDYDEVEYTVFKDSKHILEKWKDSLKNPPENFEICFANIDIIAEINTTKEKERVEEFVCKCGKALPGIKYLMEFKIRADSASENFKDVAEIKLTLQSLDCRLLVSKANQKIIQIPFATKEF